MSIRQAKATKWSPARVWGNRLRQAGVSAQVVVPVAELMADPWVRTQGLSVTQTVEGVGDVTMPGLSVRLSDTPMRLGGPPHRRELASAYRRFPPG